MGWTVSHLYSYDPEIRNESMMFHVFLFVLDFYLFLCLKFFFLTKIFFFTRSNLLMPH
jgi:hypothetical protein